METTLQAGFYLTLTGVVQGFPDPLKGGLPESKTRLPVIYHLAPPQPILGPEDITRL